MAEITRNGRSFTVRTMLCSHDPENGTWGDCYRTCIAMLLNMDPADVPHFCHEDPPEEEVDDAVDAFLATYGFEMLWFVYADRLTNVKRFMSKVNGDGYVLLLGRTKGGDSHCVVLHGDEIVDPSPGGIGISYPCDDGNYWIGVVARRTGGLDAAAKGDTK